MPSDVIVVGGGVVGLSAALECARRGAAVTLVADRRAGATTAAAGMLCPSFEAAHLGGRALLAMGRESLDLWDGFAASLPAAPAALGYRRDGAIGVGFPPGSLEGVPVPVPDGVEAGAALLVEGEGQVDPAALLAALEAACDAAGVRRRQGRAAAIEAGEDVAVRLEAGEPLTAASVIVASGAGVPEGLGEAAGLVPVRGRAFLVRAAGLPDQIVRSPGVYLCPRADGTVYLGATEEERAMPSAPDALWHEACWLVPALRGAAIVGRRDGVRPGTRDGLPIVRRSRGDARVILALGHHRNGILLAPLTARRAAALALEAGP